MIFDLTNTSEGRPYMVGEKQFDYKLIKRRANEKLETKKKKADTENKEH